MLYCFAATWEIFRTVMSSIAKCVTHSKWKSYVFTVFLLDFWCSVKSLSRLTASINPTLHSMCSCATFSVWCLSVSHDVFRVLRIKKNILIMLHNMYLVSTIFQMVQMTDHFKTPWGKCVLSQKLKLFNKIQYDLSIYNVGHVWRFLKMFDNNLLGHQTKLMTSAENHIHLTFSA